MEGEEGWWLEMVVREIALGGENGKIGRGDGGL
jgi:hypothetical protein